MSTRVSTFGLILAGLFLSLPVKAQPGGGPPDFNAMRQRFMDQMKQEMGASDEEWKLLQPKVEAIQSMQRETTGLMRMFRMFGRGFPGQADQPPTALSQAGDVLDAALKDPSTPAEVIATKLKAYREARDAARAKLLATQNELRDLLTVRQEAVLVQFGVLD